jgi:hypothetical protein
MFVPQQRLKIDDKKDRIYEELEPVFNKFLNTI